MKKFHFFGLLALICVMPLQAQQYENYDIGKYITPDIKRNKLDLEFGGSGRYNDDKINSNNTNSINGKINTKLNHYLHTRKRFSELGTEINIEGYSDKNHTSSYDSKASNFLPKFRIYSNNRFYNPSNLFLSLGAGAEADFRKDYTSRENFNTNENVKKDDKAHSYRLSVSLGAGKGRLESVEDARQAIYILENLSKQGVLTRKLSDDEIWTLAQLISTVKNKRFFDSRFHLIDEMSQIDSFFTENGLLEKNNAPYFTTLYDYWQNGALFERLSGKLFQSSFNGAISQSTNEIEASNLTDIYKHEYLHNLISWTNSFSYENPKNLFWQNSAGASFDILYLTGNSKYSAFEDKQKSMNYILSGHYGWSYYPNSRTNFSASARQTFQLSQSLLPEDEEHTFDNGGKYFTSTSSINGNVYYYFSPQLRLSANISFTGQFQKGRASMQDENINYFNKGINGGVTLTYSIY